MNNEANNEDKRQSKRIKKNFMLSYFDKSNPDIKLELTQLKDISIGGACFVTTQAFTPGKIIGIELKTPYITDTTYLEGKVIQSHERIKNAIYETRLQFGELSPEAKVLLNKMMEFFTSQENN